MLNRILITSSRLKLNNITGFAFLAGVWIWKADLAIVHITLDLANFWSLVINMEFSDTYNASCTFIITSKTIFYWACYYLAGGSLAIISDCKMISTLTSSTYWSIAFLTHRTILYLTLLDAYSSFLIKKVSLLALITTFKYMYATIC